MTPTHGKRRSFSAPLCVVLFLILLGSCHRPVAPPPPRLVILYATCTLNKNYLSPYNESVTFTPKLAGFAKQALVFTRHQTEAGQSAIAYASIFTGHQALGHGVYRPGKLADEVLTVAEAFADNGYETFFWGAHPMAGTGGNYHQGVKPENVFDRFLTAQDAAFVDVLTKLETDPSYRAFIITNFSVTHGPYSDSPVAGFRKKYPLEAEAATEEDFAKYYALYRENYFPLSWSFPQAAKRLNLSAEDLDKLSRVLDLTYKSNVHRLDGLFGQLVDTVRDRELFAQSLIVFTADHGELLYRPHAPFQWSHSNQLAHDVISVPLIMGPGARWKQTGTYDKITRSMDVFPTLLGLCDLDLASAGTIEGVDLSAALRGDEPAPTLLAYSHTSVLPESVHKKMYSPEFAEDWVQLRRYFPVADANLLWVSVRDGDTVYKLRSVAGSSWDLHVFDLRDDAAEKQNLNEGKNPQYLEMAEKLRHYKDLLVAGYENQLDELGRGSALRDEEEVLRSLGYVQ